MTRTIEELIGAVEESFCELLVDTLSKTFITLQKVIEKSLDVSGGIGYIIPHMKKDQSIDDLTAFNVQCDPTIIVKARELLNSQKSVQSSS